MVPSVVDPAHRRAVAAGRGRQRAPYLTYALACLGFAAVATVRAACWGPDVAWIGAAPEAVRLLRARTES